MQCSTFVYEKWYNNTIGWIMFWCNIVTGILAYCFFYWQRTGMGVSTRVGHMCTKVICMQSNPTKMGHHVFGVQVRTNTWPNFGPFMQKNPIILHFYFLIIPSLFLNLFSSVCTHAYEKIAEPQYSLIIGGGRGV